MSFKQLRPDHLTLSVPVAVVFIVLFLQIIVFLFPTPTPLLLARSQGLVCVYLRSCDEIPLTSNTSCQNSLPINVLFLDSHEFPLSDSSTL